MEKINVLDQGYVRLVDHMGSDLSVVNAARCSYAKESTQLGAGDVKLLNFLAREGHWSPFRHATLQFELYAPLMVARQWFKYRIGSAHSGDSLEYPINNGDDDGFGDSLHARNEASRRYITMEPTWYKPTKWRTAPANSKQGSGLDASDELGLEASARLEAQLVKGLEDYEWALAQGLAPEQARLLLPAAYGMYTAWYWTTSLQGVAYFLTQRLGHDAQWEIQQYAKGVYELVKPHFPHALEALGLKIDS